MSLMINFFVGFCIDNLDRKVQFDKVIRSNSNHVRQYAADLES